MTVKEYLSQAYRIDQRINSKLEQVASLRALATKATSTLSDTPPSGGRNSALGPGPTLPTTPGWTRIPCYSQSAGGKRAITRPGNSNSMGRSSSCGSPTG